MPLALLSFAVFMYAVQLTDTAFEQESPLLLLFVNALPFALLTFVLWAVSKRLLFSTLISLALLMGLQAINSLKYEQMMRMLSTSDFVLTRQVLSNLDLFLPYLDLSASSIVVAVLCMAVLALLLYLEPVTLRSWKTRLGTGVGSAMVLLSLLVGVAPWRTVFSDETLAGFQIWSPDRSMQRCGLAIGLIRLSWQGEIALPEVSAEQRQSLSEFVQHHPAMAPAAATTAARPDLIVVQSESLFDPSIMGQIDSSPELSGFRHIGESGVTGSLDVPAFSGGTIQTEFEVLTGYPLSAFPGVDYPYYGLTDKPLPSLPMRLQRLGYRTMMLHPYERSFWNRGSAARWLGFSDRFFESDPAFGLAPRRGPFISDDALYDATLKQLQSERPQFAFLVTIENHGPWQTRRNIDEAERDAISVPSTLNAKAKVELQNYLFHVRHGDASLRRFANALLERTKPTLLLVYGDHLPALTATYETLGFDNGLTGSLQDTPYFIVANYSLPQQRQNLESHQLPAYLMELMGLPDDGYFAISRSLRLQMQATTDAHTLQQLHQLNRIAALESYRGGESQPADALAALKHPALDNASADPAPIEGPPIVLPAPSEQAFVELIDWGPKQTTQGVAPNLQSDGHSGIWLRFKEAPKPWYVVSFDGERQPTYFNGAVISTGLHDELQKRLVSTPGRYAVVLHDDMKRRWQHLADFVVTEPPPRFIGVDGSKSANFCTVELWGPQSTRVGAAENPQPDGSMGIYVRTGCAPQDATLRFDGFELATFVQSAIVTARLPLDHLQKAGSFPLTLRSDERDEEILIGNIELRAESPSVVPVRVEQTEQSTQ